MSKFKRTSILLTPVMYEQVLSFFKTQNCCTLAEAIRILLRQALGDVASIPDSGQGGNTKNKNNAN